MICVECGAPVQSLYTIYSTDNIRATTCSICNKFADKYTEYDPVLVALDVALLRPQAIRHVVFNTLKAETTIFLRLHLLTMLFDVYIKWACTEIEASPKVTEWLRSTPTIAQYGSFLLVSASDTLIVNFVIYLLAKTTQIRDSRALFITILLSSLAKLLPLLTLIWDYDTSNTRDLSLFLVGFTTTEFLSVSLNCSYVHALAITAIALGVRWYVCECLIWPWILAG